MSTLKQFQEVASASDGASPVGLPVSVGAGPDVAKSPIVFLGSYGGRVVFAMPDGTIRDEVASRISSMLRTDIFACPEGRAFLAAWQDPKDGRFKREEAAAWFNTSCRNAGFYDTERIKRRIGVWLGENDEVILHRGSEVWTFKGAKYKTSSIVEMIRNAGDGPLYEVQPSTPAPTKPPKAADRAWLRADLNLWQFEPIGRAGLTGADIVIGFIGAGMLGAVAPFRGHVLISAQAGSGKTTLLEFVQRAMGAIAPSVTNDFSPAGLKNELGGRARPILLDEAEASTGAEGLGSIETALEYFRRMSTGSGGMRKQGDVGGKTTTHYIIGSAMMAAITPPKLQPADASRFLEIRLAPLLGDRAPEGSAGGDVQAALERAKKAAPALLGLALRNADRYRADFKLLKGLLVELHQSPRAADLVASFAAGRRMMLHDEPLDFDGAAREVKLWGPLLEVRSQTEATTNIGIETLELLLGFEAVRGPPKRFTVGDIVDQYFEAEKDRPHQKDNLRRIRQMGIIPVDVDFEPLKSKSISVPGEKRWLVIANRNPELEAIFSKTKYKDYRNCLMTLNHLSEEFRPSSCEPLKFSAGSTHRAIAIPYTPHYGGNAEKPSVTPAVTSQGTDFDGSSS